MLTQDLESLLETAGLLVGPGQRALGQGRRGIDLDRALRQRDRFIEPPRQEERGGRVPVHDEGERIEIHRETVLLDRQVDPPGRDENDGIHEVRGGVSGVELDRVLDVFFGCLPFPLPESVAMAIEVCASAEPSSSLRARWAYSFTF